MLTRFAQRLINTTTTYLDVWQISEFLNANLLESRRCNFSGIAIALLTITIVVAITFYTRKPKGCLDPIKFKEFRLVKRTKVSHNTDRFRFALPTPTAVLGLPVGQHIRCRGRDSEGQKIVRPYTPITLVSDVGYFEIVVKMYPQGRMTHHFRQMCEGDYLSVIGPLGRFRYRPGQVRAFGMLAGGTGITPMYQVIRAILENQKDLTNIHLIFANHTVDDILLKEDLDGLAIRYPDRFKVHYVVSQPPMRWSGGIGHISKDMIQRHCPEPAPDIMILKCGPREMNKAMTAYLDELGYTQNMQFKF